MARLYGPGPEDPPRLIPTADLAGLSTSDVEDRPVGELFGSLAEEGTGLIRYLDVAVREGDRHVLVPIGHARIDREAVPPRVRLRAATFEDLMSVPPFVPRSTPVDRAYEVVLWRGRCPEEHRAAYLAMRNQMNADVPTGDLDLQPEVLDDARLSASEERLTKAYDVRVAAARRRSDGVFGGYSLLFVPHGTDYGWQDDTLVMPEHRGHRLGAALKAANYADLPGEVTRVHTWTAPDNAAMHRTNTALGFWVVERMYEMDVTIA